MEHQRGRGHLAQTGGVGLQQGVSHHDDEDQSDELGAVLPADEPSEEPEHLDAEIAHPPRLLGDLLADGALQAVRPYGVDPVETADQRLRTVGLRGPLPAVERRGAGQVPPQGQRVRGQCAACFYQAEPPVQSEHADRGDDDQHARREHGGDGRPDASGQHGHVVTDPGQHIAPADLFDACARHPEHRTDGALPQPGEQIRAQPPDQIRRERGGHRAEQRGGPHQHADRDQHGARFALDHPVDHLAQQEHGKHLERRPGHRGEHGGGRQPRGAAAVRHDPRGGLAPGRRAQGCGGDGGVCGTHTKTKSLRGRGSPVGIAT